MAFSIDRTAFACEVDIFYRAITPIFQSAPPSKGARKGNAAEGRQMPVLIRNDRAGSEVLVPEPSAMAVRAPVREKLMRRVLFELGLADAAGWVKTDGRLSRMMVEILVKGGRNTAGEAVSLTSREYADLYRDLPFLGLFGTFWLPGLLGVSMVQPLVEGLESTWLTPDHPFAGKVGPLEQFLAGGRHSFRGVYGRLTRVDGDGAEETAAEDVIAYCRANGAEELADRLEQDVENTPEEAQKYLLTATREYLSTLGAAQQRAVLEILGARLNVSFSSANLSAYRDEVLKKFAGLGRQQNLYELRHFIPAGTPLVVKMDMAQPPVDGEGAELLKACFDAAVEIALALPVIGAMAARGFGHVVAEGAVRVVREGLGKFRYEEDVREKSRASVFWDWVKENRDTVTENLAKLEQKLGIRRPA